MAYINLSVIGRVYFIMWIYSGHTHRGLEYH